MNCEQYQENISQFIDGELECASETSLFQHLSTCDECCRFLKETMNLRSELLNKQTVTVPERLKNNILAKIVTPSITFWPKNHNFEWLRQGRMISLRIVGFALVIAILASIAFTSLWYRSNIVSNETVVYMPTLPTVEVRGYIPSSSNLNN
jgi:predicted anti-sigma-YlaC factor YlaD